VYRLIKILLTLQFIFMPLNAWAQTSGIEDTYMSRISEYFYNKTGREVLRPVQLLGGVAKPGLYHIPEGTSLTTLLAISGGTTPDAEVREITIRNSEGKKFYENLPKVAEGGTGTTLKGGEIIYIPRKEGWIDQPTAQTLTVLTSILSVFLTAYLVHDSTK